MFLFFYAFMIFYVQLCRRFRKQNMHCEQRRCCFMLFLSNSEVSTVPHLYPFVTILNCRLLNLREQELRCYLRHWTHHWQAAVGFRTSTWRECFLYFTSSSLINLYFIQWEFPFIDLCFRVGVKNNEPCSTPGISMNFPTNRNGKRSQGKNVR